MSALHEQNIKHTPCKNVRNWYDERNPEVSIIVLNFNKANLTIECLKSLWEHTTEHHYEIIVVDNGSEVEDFLKLLAFKGAYQLLRLELNRFFGEGNNIGAEHAKGNFLLFLNNDTTVTSGWLTSLMAGFRLYSDCGAVGPKFVYPDGSLQEAGALIDEDASSIQIGKYQDPNDPRFNQSRAVDYVSAAAILMRKQLFENVFGFDFGYEPAYYEDVDLCLAFGQLGLKTYYISESCVVHHENATTSDKTHGIKLNSIVELNRLKFMTRWKGYLKTAKHVPLRQRKSVSRPYNKSKPTSKAAAVYTQHNIVATSDDRYLLAIIEHLLNEGYTTWLVVPEIFSLLRIKRIGSIFNLNLNSVRITTYKAASEMPHFDVFVALGSEIVPQVKPIGRVSFYLCQFKPHNSDVQTDLKVDCIKLYNAIMAYSNFSKENILKKLNKYKLPSPDIYVISPPVNLLSFDPKKTKNSIVSIGSFCAGENCMQQDMMIRSLQIIYELGVDVELHLVGLLTSEPTHVEYFFKCKQLSHGLPVYFHLDVEEDRLISLFEKSSIYWHATGFQVDQSDLPEKCEQSSIHIVQAMSAGLIPIVVNNGAPTSIVQHGVSGYCYDSQDQLIEFTLDLILGEEEQILERRKHATIRSRDFSKNVFSDQIRKIISMESISKQ